MKNKNKKIIDKKKGEPKKSEPFSSKLGAFWPKGLFKPSKPEPHMSAKPSTSNAGNPAGGTNLGNKATITSSSISPPVDVPAPRAQKRSNPAPPSSTSIVGNESKANKPMARAIDHYSGKINSRQSAYEHAIKLDSIPIVLGVDLGTSSTKVIWREEYNEEAYPMQFSGKGNALDDYLIPSEVIIGKGRITSRLMGSETEEPEFHQLSNFKMCLACESSDRRDCGLQRCSLSNWEPVLSMLTDPDTNTIVEAVNALHLAVLILHCREAIEDRLRRKGVKKAVRWTINLSIPVEHMDETAVRQAFERVLKSAWMMSHWFEGNLSPMGIIDLLNLYHSAVTIVEGRTLDCFVYPEVAAQVTGLCKSRSAHDGLYAFIDIGAGTVDASIFRLYSGGDDGQLLSFYAGHVLKEGAAHIESEAAMDLTDRSRVWLKEVKERRSLVGLQSFLSPDEAKQLLDHAGQTIGKRVERKLRATLKDAFEKERNKGAWDDLVLLLGGGGCELLPYVNASQRAFGGLAERLTTEKLPVPQDLQMGGLPSVLFHRFAVAYGLSFDTIVLPEVGLPDEVAPLSLEIHRPRRRVVEALTDPG
jgi:hypothetical protein